MTLSTNRLRNRLQGREELDRSVALTSLAEGLDRPEFESLAELLEREIGVPVGLLRPDDRLGDVFAQFSMGNPLTWVVAEARFEDGLTEVRYELSKRQKARGEAARPLRTVHDLFAAWCGIG